MHVKGFLHKLLSPVMHKKRLETFSLLVITALKSKKLSLTWLGRSMELPIKERSAIRRADRFLGNIHLHSETDDIFKNTAALLIGANMRPDIIVDWSNVPNTTHHVLRAAIVAEGRSLTIYEEVHPEKKLGNKEVQNTFLKKLKSLLPAECKPIIISDAGFHNDWFREILRIRWDYIGRIRGKKYLRLENKEWQKCSDIFKRGSNTPKLLGRAILCKSNSLEVNICIFKGKSKGRFGLNRAGKKRKDSTSLEYRKAAKEPWLLATSLKKNSNVAKKVVKKYRNRMQIEEGFRDLKSSRYGLSFEDAYTNKIVRIKVMLLIAMLASIIAWATGHVVEKKKLHYQFQSNSTKTKRVLSLFFLGCQAIKRQIKIQVSAIIAVFEEKTACAI